MKEFENRNKPMSNINKPLLLTFAVERSQDCDQVLFHYDYSRDMNVLDADPEIPFIEAGNLPILMTITKSDREIDTDDEKSCRELYTKKDVARETDDDERRFAELVTKTAVLHELYTKTEQIRERDDEGISMVSTTDMYYLRELVSKTFTDRERDDEDDNWIPVSYPPRGNHNAHISAEMAVVGTSI